MRLIDADELKTKLKDEWSNTAIIYRYAIECCLDIVENTPTVDAQPAGQSERTNECAALEITFKRAGKIIFPAKDFTEYKIHGDKLLVVKDGDTWRYACALDEVFSIALLTEEEVNAPSLTLVEMKGCKL